MQGKDFALVTRHIRKLPGGSQPILAQASDGLLYVVKFTHNPQGANLAFNESVGSELYRACGLAVPAWKPLLVTDAFITQNQDCWIQTPEGRLRPNSGLCFGSRFLGGNGIHLLEILPGASFKRVRSHKNFWLAWLVDICAEHSDNRQAIFLEDGTGWLNAFFVDHGHLFGGPKGELRLNFRASRYLDPRIYQSVSLRQLLIFQSIVSHLDVDQLWRQVQTLPDDWKAASVLSSFMECLNRLSNVELLQNIVDTMVNAQQQTNEYEKSKRQTRRKPLELVLCPGVQGAGLEHRFAAKSCGRSACA
ncbi:MAG: hypothetical protein WAN35_16930 [Terracidiphilus sp.]